MKDRAIKIINKYKYVFTIIAIGLLFPSYLFASADKVFKSNSNSVVVIVTYDSKGNPIMQGSGFVVRADGVIVTNYHVISEAVEVKVKVSGAVLNVTGYLYEDKDNDLVILKTDGTNLPFVTIGNDKRINIGEKVFVISSPKGFENTISDGILSGIREVMPERKYLQITAPVSPGSSGGPVFNETGEVIGIVTFLIDKAQNINFALPISLIKDKINNNKVTKLPKDSIGDYKNTSEYWALLGLYFADLHLADEAVKAFEKAIEISPDNYRYYSLAGSLYNLAGDKSKALQYLYKATQLNPNDADAFTWIGVTFNDLKEYNDAAEAYKQSIRIQDDSAFAHYGLGVTYKNLGLYDLSISAFQDAIKLQPDDADSHYKLGHVFVKLQKYERALDEYKEAARLKPTDAEIFFMIGSVYEKLNKLADEMEAYKQAIKINPDYAEAHYGLGGVYAAYLNDKKAALEEYRILQKLNPDLASRLFDLIYK